MFKALETTKGKYLSIILIITVTTLLFVKVGSFGFISVWDDNLNILNNDYIKNFSLHSIKILFSNNTPIAEPRLTLFTYAIDYKLWNLEPKMYHLENLILHLINIILIFVICFKLLPKVSFSALVALLFALHPFRVESVAWVSGRKDLLYTLFFLMAVLVYLRYLKKQQILWFILVIILGYLSYLSKIQALTLPVVLLLTDFYLNRQITVRVLFEKVLVGVILVFTSFEISYFILLLFLLIFIDKYDSITAFVKKKFHFIYKLYSLYPNFYYQLIFRVLPVFIIFLFSFFIFENLFATKNIKIVYDVVIAILFLFICWHSFEYMLSIYKHKKKLFSLALKHHIWIIPLIIMLAAIIIFIIYIKPGTNIWNDGFSNQFSFYDQLLMTGYAFISYFFYAFFPVYISSLRPYPDFSLDFLPVSYYFLSALAVILIVVLIFAVIKFKSIRKELIFGLLFFFINIFLVMHIIPIKGRVIIAERYTYLAYFGLFFIVGIIFNKLSESKKLKKCIPGVISIFIALVFFVVSWFRLPVWKNEVVLLNNQITKNPEYPTVYLNRSNLFINQKNYLDAIEDLNKAIKLKPDYYQAYYNRAIAFSSMNIFDKAAEDCSQAIKLSLNFSDAYYLRAFSYNKMQKYHQAIADYDRALQINPMMYLAYYNRGNSKKNISDYKAAIKDYNITLKIRPDFSEAYNGRGVAKYFTKDFYGSVKDYTKAIALDPQNGNTYFNRALSYKSINESNKSCADLYTAIQKGYAGAKEVYDKNCK